MPPTSARCFLPSTRPSTRWLASSLGASAAAANASTIDTTDRQRMSVSFQRERCARIIMRLVAGLLIDARRVNGAVQLRHPRHGDARLVPDLAARAAVK